MKSVTFSDVKNLKNPVFVDVRSPKEFIEDHIPGALNLPLFSDWEREVIGKIYKFQGVSQAKLAGLNFLSPKLPRMVNEILKYKEQGDVVIYCWRGGLRSFVLAEILRMVDIYVYRLEGGYKSYRREVVKFFETVENLHPIVLYGMTGVGKTKILENLQRQELPVLNLEKLANHRGSVFGHLGLEPQPSQKFFESKLYEVLKDLQGIPFLTEGESQKIGKLFIPRGLFKKMQEAPVVLLELPEEKRIENLMSEYKAEKIDIELFIKALQSITPYLGRAKVEKLIDDLRMRRFYDFTKTLLLDYYDPLYKKSTAYLQNIKKVISGKDIDELTAKVGEFWREVAGGKQK
ncbi:tRNA 2-selenouridine(34) synthase MnmH [Carboxydothermus ferrireducens]|uniref:tRNA 2-selenouridine synthase n=1 Tax=Carboxydothermus ferrireducens DSM 11255 TaxID=1119529 RepID=A0ABX2R948_9THEO|nr:tRNA 2-selenouridine(34) synthase MnmH [Carboxydothermus ferrireducens]NYE57067.1 tRNA 2-selenouridine synthase [Carboxydothermus ferrireducens DSM 11255]